ncbi:MAG TPA: glycosyltransferase family 9 protein [Usitatibacteraceae bacterium]|nr:glycosyltransferase family 9 protein [Usitatibacteraceae bacterium]
MNPVALISNAEAQQARKVLLINVTRIGDTVLATPAIRAIAAHFPNARLTCLGHADRIEVLQNLPYVAKTGAITKRSAPLRGWMDTLRGPEYDYAFVWRNDAALLRYALRKARHVIAARQGTKVDSRLYAAVDMPRQSSMHAVAWHLALTDAVGIPRAGLALDVRVTPAELGAARSRLDALFPSGGRPLIGLQVASFPTKRYRDWPIAHFEALMRRVLYSHPDSRFVLFGGAADRERIAPLLAIFPGKAAGVAGALSLRQTLAVMHHTDAYVGVDTGPTHLYGALRKPMVALYHPALPSALFRPLGHPALHAIDHPAAGPSAGPDIAIGEIPVDTVAEALGDALAGRPSRWPGLPAPGIDPGATPYPGDPGQKV